MKALIPALLVLLPLLARAGDTDVSCDVTGAEHKYGGVNKTLDACNPDSPQYNLGRCQQRLDRTIQACHGKLGGIGEDPQEIQRRIDALTEAKKNLEARLKEGGAESQGEAGGQTDATPARDGGGGGGRIRSKGGGPLGIAPGSSQEKDVLSSGDDKKITSLGKGYLDDGKPQDAERVLDKAIEINPKNSDALGLRAAAVLAQQRPDDALRDAGRALELDPSNKVAQDIQGYARASQFRFDPGKVKLKKPSFGSPDSESLPDKGRPGQGPASGPEAAQTEAQGQAEVQAKAVSPAQALLDEAARKFTLGDYTGALLLATRAIKADPTNAKAWAWRARISNQLNNPASAIEDANEALKLDPKNVSALLERGYAEYKQGDFQLALRDIDQALSYDLNNGLGYLYRGMILEKLGRLEEAAASYRRAAQLDGALKPLAEQGLARLGGKPQAAPPARRFSAVKVFLPLLLGLTALGFLFEGVKRVLRPGWRTTAPPAVEEEAASFGATLPPGVTLGGNFRIERELARGGMGIVYEATDLTLKRAVAVKQLKKDSYDLPELRERFLREAQVVARLRHPNLAQIYSVVTEPELCLVFELVEGEPLDRLIARRGKLTLAQVKAYASDLCAALECAHGNNVIHRDLKPSNVMIDKDGTCKVMDFGIAHEARSMSKITQTGGWGTPPYMAPEQELGAVCRESDLFSLAVMTYEMLTGRLPFAGPAFLARKLAKEFPPITTLNPDLPPSADEFFAKALDPEPAHRHRTASEFLKAFQVLGETPVGA